MRKLLIPLALVSVLTGCASTTLPTCDGTDRRPINAPARADILYPSCGTAA
jgi:hypothetical protein